MNKTKRKEPSLKGWLRKACKQRRFVNRELGRLYLLQMRPLIFSTTRNMSATYKLSNDDLDDLRSHVQVQLLSKDWMGIIRRSKGRDMQAYLETATRSMCIRALDTHTKRGFTLSPAKIGKRTTPLGIGQLPTDEDGVIALADPRTDIHKEAQQQELLDRAHKSWNDEQRDVIRLHYGLDNGDPKTIAQIAIQLRISEHKVGQIIKSALQAAQEHLGIIRVER